MTNINRARLPQELPWVYTDGEKVVYRAFAIGDCLRSLVASRLGEHPTPPPGYLKEVFEESGSREEEAIAAYEEEFGVTVNRQAESELMVRDGIVIRGHMDGLVPTEVLEVKWLSAINFEKYCNHGLDGLGILGRKYAWQGATYGHSRNLPVRFLIGNKAVSPDAEVTERLLFGELYDPNDLVALETIVSRVEEIERYAEQDELPDCDGKCSTSSFFAHVHFFDSESGYVASEELTELIRRAWDMKVLLEGHPDFPDQPGLVDQFKNLKDQIKLSRPGVHVAGPVSAQIIQKKESKRLSSKKVKAKYPDVFEDEDMFDVSPPSRSVILKMKNSGTGQSTVL